MKKIKTTMLMILIILMCSIMLNDRVNAITVKLTGDSYEWSYTDSPYAPVKYVSGTTTKVFCGQFNKNEPSNITCNLDKNWDETGIHSAAIGWIIKQNYNYAEKETLINYYLGYTGEMYNGRSGVSRYNGTAWAGDYYNSYIYITKDFYDNVLKNKFNALQKYLSGIPIKSTNDGAAIKLSKAGLQCDSDGKCSGTLYVYNLGNEGNGWNNNFDLSYSATGLQNCYIKSSNSINTDAGNQRWNLGLECQFKSGTNFNNSLKLSVTATSKNKIYSVDRYDCGSSYQKVFLDSASAMKVSTTVTPKVVITNEPEPEPTPKDYCEDAFESIKNNRSARVALYEEILDKYGKNYNYNSLLNFNIEDADSACSQSKCTYSTSTACLSGENNINKKFNKDNLSCYNDVINIDGEKVYCLTSYELESTINLDDIQREYVFDYDYLNLDFYSFSGRFLVQQKTPTASIGKLKQECYYYHNSKGSYEKFKQETKLSESDYNDLVKDVHLEYSGEKILLETISGTSIFNESVNNEPELNLYFSSNELLINHNFNRIYIDKTTGEIVTEPNNNTLQSEYYGIVSKGNDKVGQVNEMNFSYNFNGNTYGASCFYKITADPNDVQDLEFRTIDIDNAFIGRSGKGRTPGANWSISRITNLVLNERNDSFNTKRTEPLYKITLTPEKIKKIRQYNKEKSYDDYELTCVDDVCTNEFLNNLSIFTSEEIERKNPFWETEYSKKLSDSLIYGDVTGDTEINIKDATLIKKYVQNALDDSIIVDIDAADVNLDGIINIYDYEIIQKYTAKKIKSLPIVYGDANEDDEVNIRDVSAILKNDANVNKERADVNLDGVVDNVDATIIQDYISKKIKLLPYTQTIYGDANGDNKVNIKDVSAIKKGDTNINKERADVNLDGVVNDNDATIISNYISKKIESLPYAE